MSVQIERSRKWGLLLYMDDPSHKSAFDELIKLDGVSCSLAYIIHDKDVFSEDSETPGQLKKSHIHVVLDWHNSVWNSALAKHLGIEINYIRRIRNYENALEYLIHYHDKDKFQYSIDEVKGTLKNKLADIISKDGRNESDRVLDLMEFILNYEGVLHISDLVKWSACNGYWDIFRRSSTIFIGVINEHNNALLNK